MSTNPVNPNPAPASPLTSDRVSSIVSTVTSVITAIEQIIAASGVGGPLGLGQIEKLTTLFGNLAGVAIQAAHDVMGQNITPESVMSLLPVTTALAEPAGQAAVPR